MRIEVALNERVLVHLDGRPARYLTPGRHTVFAPFQKIELVRVNTDLVIADLRAEQLALVPAEDLTILNLGADERAVISRRGRPVRWLGSGEHQVWTVDRRLRQTAEGKSEVSLIAIDRLDLSKLEAQPLRDEVRPFVPAIDYVEVTAPEGAVALRYVDGALDAVLPAGRHAAWTSKLKVHFAVIDLRERLLQVSGQEVMTKDRVTLRLNASAVFRVADPRRLATVAREPDDVLYLAVQLAMREAIASRTLDELLASRDEISTGLTPLIAERALAVGLKLESFGVKDVVLPGEMRTMLNRVIEAQKEAEANVILRREETAAVRSMAQTAKILAENPLVVRLKELETYEALAAKVGQVHLVVGDGAMSKLQLKV